MMNLHEDHSYYDWDFLTVKIGQGMKRRQAL